MELKNKKNYDRRKFTYSKINFICTRGCDQREGMGLLEYQAMLLA
jgi:hypothetical protein